MNFSIYILSNILSASPSQKILKHTIPISIFCRGNIWWNGGADMSLGLGDSTGCQNSNPTCNEAQLMSDNEFNTINVGLSSPNSK